MFDIAWSELLVIAVVALIFIGPKELPQVLHTLGRMTAKLRRSADEFRRQFEDSVREAGYEDLRKNLEEFRSLHPANHLKDSIARAINQENATPKPATPVIDQPPAAESNASQADPQKAEEAGSGQAPQTAVGENKAAAQEGPAAPEPEAPSPEAPKDRIAPAA